MLKYIFTFITVFISINLKSQTVNSLFSLSDKDSISIGWFIKPHYQSINNNSKLNQDVTHLTGGTVGLVINKKIQIGVTGSAKTSKLNFRKEANNYGISYGYGGLNFVFSPKQYKIIHFAFGTSIGYGGALEYDNTKNIRGATLNTLGFFYIEPELSLELNVSNYIRFYLSCTYRYLDTNNFKFIDSNLFNGFGLKMGIVIVKL